MIVCICQNVSDRQIRALVAAGATTMSEVRDELRVGTCCGKCNPHAKQVLREALEAADARDRQGIMIFRSSPGAT